MIKTLYVVVLIFGINQSSAQTFEGDKKEIERILENIATFSEYYISVNYEALTNFLLYTHIFSLCC